MWGKKSIKRILEAERKPASEGATDRLDGRKMPAIGVANEIGPGNLVGTVLYV